MRQSTLFRAMIALATVVTLGCGDESPTGGPPGTAGGATIQVFINTIGINADADGYRVRVTGQGVNRTESVGSIDDVTFSGLAEGDYTVGLEAVAANCVVDDAQVSFSLTEANPRLITFSVVCS